MGESSEPFSNAKILVVGGAGFVGSNLIHLLIPKQPREILVIDNLLSSEKANIPCAENVRFIEGSISEDRILALIPDDVDYVFHLATFHGNQNSIHDPLADHENNTLTTLKLYETIKSMRGIRKVVYASAGCTVAEKTFEEAHSTTEDAPVSLWLDSPYQISKIIGELYSNYYFQQYRLPVVKARFQNVYGPREILGAGKWRGTYATVWRNVIPTFIYKAIKGEPLPVEGDGSATRDFIYVEDIGRGLILCATVGKPGEVYNLASGQETSILDLATQINRLTGNQAPIAFLPRRSWDHSGKRFGSTVKSKKALGFEAEIDLETGLKRTIAWTLENIAFIEACIRKHDAHLNAVSH